VQANSWRNHVV